MGPYLEKYKQNIAIDMRKRGFSYSEIGNRIHIPKSTLSYWLKNIKLTPEQTQKLNDKRIEVAKANALKKISKTAKTIEEIKNSSAQDIKEISKKELWLMGVVLYWKNGNRGDLKKGVHFSSSDPAMINLFLKWLREVGGVEDKEIKFHIFIKRRGFKTSVDKKNKMVDESIDFWSKATGVPKSHFSNIYFQKTNRGNNPQPITDKYTQPAGFLRVKVAESSMLARQIAGWIEGLKRISNL